MSLGSWKRIAPVRHRQFIEAIYIFKNYESVWLMLEESFGVESLASKFWDAVDPPNFLNPEIRLLVTPNNLIYLLQHVCVPRDSLDRKNIKEVVERLRSLDPETLIDFASS